MRRLYAWAATDDWVNPLAIREFRQAVQSRWVIAMLMLFLFVNLMFVGSYLALSTDAATDARGGQRTLASLMVILMITCVGFVPLYAGLRLSLERNDANIDLLFITTIRPGAIVRGKYLSAMALTLLIFSACMPFMVLTYLLGGVDVPTILFLLAAGYAACAVANALGIFAGSVSGSWLIRGFVLVGVLILLGYIGVGVISMLEEFLFRGMGIATVNFWQFWGMIGTSALLGFFSIGLLYVLSVAMLSPLLSNRMFVPRIYLIFCWIVTGVVAAIWSWHEHEIEPIGAWQIVSGVAWTITAVAAMGERDMWTSRVRRSIPRNAFLRAFAFLLYTGSAGGVIFSTIMFAATIAVSNGVIGVLGVAPRYSSDSFNEATVNLAMVFGYILCYCLTTAFLRITVLRRLPTTSLAVVTVIVAGAAAIVPYLIVFMLQDTSWHSPPWYVMFSPMMLTTGPHSAVETAVPVVLAWLALSLVLSMRWVFGQWRQFIPLAAK